MNLSVKFRRSVMLSMKTLSVLSVTLVFVFIWRTFYRTAIFNNKGNYVVVLSFLLLFFLFSRLYNGFNIGVRRLHEIVYSQALAIVFTDIIMYFQLSLISRKLLELFPIIICMVLQFGFSAFAAYCLNTVYFQLYKPRKMIAVFDNDVSGLELIRKMSAIPERFSIEKGVSSGRYELEEIEKMIDKYDAVIISDIAEDKKYTLIHYCYNHQKRIYVLPSGTDVIMKSSYTIQISDTPVFMCKNRGLTVEQRAAKRLFDILLSLFGIILFSPLMLGLAFAIKICDGGPVFFKQNRVTYAGKIFNVIKFRSMVVDADKNGAEKAADNDKRITAVGRFMRPFRLDELPQLFNILGGTMSFVGPRPERTENVYEYTEKYPDFSLRHKVKAGLTGYAQIYGKYNTSPEDKLKMDLIYIEQYSLLMDIKLLIMTVKILFMKESTEGFKK